MLEHIQIEDSLESNKRFSSYKVYNKQSGRRYYLKKYHINENSDINSIRNWQSEFNTISEEFSRISAPTIRSLVAGGVDPAEGAYAIFEWFEMSSVESLLEDGFTLALAKDVAMSALDALAFLQERGYVHAAISPETICFTDSKEKNCWVVDWDPIQSLACKYGARRFGMNIFTAPELLNGGCATHESEMYALGATIAKCLEGIELDPVLETWLKKMCSKSPASRFKTVAESKEWLGKSETEAMQRQLLISESGPVPKPSNVQIGSQPTVAAPALSKVHLILIGVAGVVLLGLGVVVTVFALKGKDVADDQNKSRESKPRVVQNESQKRDLLPSVIKGAKHVSKSGSENFESGSLNGLEVEGDFEALLQRRDYFLFARSFTKFIDKEGVYFVCTKDKVDGMPHSKPELGLHYSDEFKGSIKSPSFHLTRPAASLRIAGGADEKRLYF